MNESAAFPPGPFRRMVVLGDSIAYGMCASRPENEWSQVVAGLLRRFQDVELEVLNRGLPAEVIGPRAPGYEESAKPALIDSSIYVLIVWHVGQRCVRWK